MKVVLVGKKQAKKTIRELATEAVYKSLNEIIGMYTKSMGDGVEVWVGDTGRYIPYQMMNAFKNKDFQGYAAIVVGIVNDDELVLTAFERGMVTQGRSVVFQAEAVTDPARVGNRFGLFKPAEDGFK